MKRARERDITKKKPPQDLWKTLPRDVWFIVFEFLQFHRMPQSFLKDMSRFACVCRAFREATLGFTPWRVVMDIRAIIQTGTVESNWYKCLYRFAAGRGKAMKAMDKKIRLAQIATTLKRPLLLDSSRRAKRHIHHQIQTH